MIVLLRWEDWVRHLAAADDLYRAVTVLERRLAELVRALALAVASNEPHALMPPAAHIVLCPPSSRRSGPRWAGIQRHLEDRLAGYRIAQPTLSSTRAVDAAARLGAELTNDERADALAWIPYEPQALSVLGVITARAAADSVGVPAEAIEAAEAGLVDGDTIHRAYRRWRRRRPEREPT